MSVNKWCFTFGQAHCHPVTGNPLRDYWVEVIAGDFDAARDLMVKVFGTKWCGQYESETFDTSYFPRGKFITLSF